MGGCQKSCLACECPSAERKGKMAWRLCRSVVLPHETMEPVLDAFTDSHPPRGRPERLAVITGSFQIFPDRRWASLRLGTNARLPPKWHVCLSVCSLRCARRLPRATSTKSFGGEDDATHALNYLASHGRVCTFRPITDKAGRLRRRSGNAADKHVVVCAGGNMPA